MTPPGKIKVQSSVCFGKNSKFSLITPTTVQFCSSSVRFAWRISCVPPNWFCQKRCASTTRASIRCVGFIECAAERWLSSQKREEIRR